MYNVYEQKVNELKTGGVVIPDLVLANKILRAANLLQNHYLGKQEKFLFHTVTQKIYQRI